VNTDLLNKYIHNDWDDLSCCKSDKHYFVKIGTTEAENFFQKSNINYQSKHRMIL